MTENEKFFEKQLSEAIPFGQHDLSILVAQWEALNLPEAVESKTKYYSGKIGKKMAFYLFSDTAKVEVYRVFEDELAEVRGLVFERMSGNIPIFKRGENAESTQ